MHLSEPSAVLYVDDEEANRILFEATMADRFSILMASSGAEALDIIATQPVDVLLTDYRMPMMNGVELCREVAREYPYIQRLLVTAYVDTQSAVDAINHGGVSRYLGKPWDIDELEQVLDDALTAAVRGRLSYHLQEEILRRERIAAVAQLQGQVLHDLGNASSMLEMGCSSISEMLGELRGVLPNEQHAVLERDMADMQVALDYVTDLHTRVRGLHRASEPKREALDVSDMLHSASVLARASLPRRGRIEIDVDAGVQVLCDRTDFGRILVNLVTNAAQALADARVDNGRIWLEGRRQEGVLCISVHDNGPGVPDDLRELIFEEHFTTKGAKGSGVGLPASRRLAEDNGGSLELVQSDEGARFEVRLPLAELVGA